MLSLNKVLLYGNLVRDPELRELPGGGGITSFSIATNRRVKKNDQWEDATDFHNIIAFGKQAESCATFLKKGDSCFVEGRIQTRSWEKDGVKQYRTEIAADRVQFGEQAKKKSAPAVDTASLDALFPD